MSASISIGFGFVPGETAHCFVVTIPRGEEGEVVIAEQFCYDPDAERTDTPASAGLADAVPDEPQQVETETAEEVAADRSPTETACPPRHLAVLSLERWLCIENDVRVEFNRRLRRAKLKSGVWKNGDNPLALPFGRELTLLCWAIERAEIEEIPAAYRNWAAFTPEERQWLYTTVDVATAAAGTEPSAASAWRRAIRIALVETSPHQRPLSPPPLRPEPPPRPKPAATQPAPRPPKRDLQSRIAQPSLPCLDES